MAGENAQLGFSVDTSEVETASKRLNELAKSAQGAADSAGKLSDSFEESMKGVNSSITSNHQAMRELTVMMHEAMSGNWSRLRGSAMIMGGALGFGGLTSGAVVGGITLVSEGIESLIEGMREAQKAETELNNSAVITADVSLLNSDYVDSLTIGYEKLGYSATQAKGMIAALSNAGMFGDEFSVAGKQIAALSKALGGNSDEQKKLAGQFGGLYSDPLGHVNEFFQVTNGWITKTEQNRINAAEQSHNSAQAEMAMQEALLDVYKRQTDMLQLKAYLETNAATYSAFQTREQFGSAWGKGEKEKADAFIKQYDERQQSFNQGVEKLKGSIHETGRQIRENVEEFNKGMHPHKVHTHHGLTAIEKAAKQLVTYQTQIKQAGLQFDQQINSIGDSVNNAWSNKLYSYSMSSDQNDFANRIEQINEQFDRMRENVDRLALQHHKSIGSKEYVEMFQKIELGRKNVLAENVAGFNEMESLQHSALAGMDEGWIKYQKQVNDVASQSEKVFDTAVEGMTNSLTDFFTTGEAGWTNFVKSIATITEKYMVQDWIVEPLAGLVKGGISSLFSSNPLSSTTNTFAVPDIPKLGATHLGGGLGSTAPVINITINDNGNKGGVDSNVSGTTGQVQKMGAALDKFLQNYIKEQNVKSNRQGGLNKTMGNWSTR
ncbi:TPA: phage tail tape-measure protein [Escherichia coli]|nr:phage tail tape-measure protein [Escherichia coli]HBB9157998.1 phage tail tape-measure protein [Escherichia coli]